MTTSWRDYTEAEERAPACESDEGTCQVNGSILGSSGLVFLESGKSPTYNSSSSFIAMDCPCWPKYKVLH